MRKLDLGDEETLTADRLFLQTARFGFSAIKVMIDPRIKPVAKVKLQVGSHCCSDQFRSDMNDWLRDWFGVEYPVYTSDNLILMSEITYDEFMKEI